MREHVGVTGPLPSATARGKALQREIAALGVAASCEGADLWAASRDCSPAALLWAQARMISHPPDVVAWPEEAEQVAALIRLAAGRGVPVVPMGAGTGTGGGAVALRGGIVLDTKRLTHPLRVDLPGNVVEVGAGMSAERLEERLAYAGATLGHLLPPQDPGTVGGWLATRGAGMLSARHGSSADLVLSLEAVDGRTWRSCCSAAKARWRSSPPPGCASGRAPAAAGCAPCASLPCATPCAACATWCGPGCSPRWCGSTIPWTPCWAAPSRRGYRSR
jgi:FAD/FMN-containing dehydrogenase